MTPRRASRAGRDAGLDAGPDAGFTMIEVVVSLTIMSLAMAMFTTGVLEVYRFLNRDEATSTAQSQLALTFLRLDREVRYATGISLPGTVGPDVWVEYLTTATGTGICTELRLRPTTRQLQHRAWPQGQLPGAANPWHTLAFEVTAAQPFTLLTPDTDISVQRLRLRLTASGGAGQTAATKSIDVTFAALNTSVDTTSATICTEGRAVP